MIGASFWLYACFVFRTLKEVAVRHHNGQPNALLGELLRGGASVGVDIEAVVVSALLTGARCQDNSQGAGEIRLPCGTFAMRWSACQKFSPGQCCGEREFFGTWGQGGRGGQLPLGLILYLSR